MSPTRASLAATALNNSRWFAGLIAGTTAMLPALSLAGTWTGSVSSDWNNSSNWTAGGAGGTVQVNSTPANIATITADFLVVPTQIVVANGGTAVGRVDHRAGAGSVAAGNDVSLGRSGGNATYNLANTATPGAGITGFATGSGSLTIPDQLWVGGVVSGVSTGVLNINTTGTLSVGTQLLAGNLGGTGTVRMEAGTLTVAGDMEIGNGAAATGTLTQTGGTITKTGGGTAVTIGGGVSPALSGGTGTATLNGGTFTSAGVFRVGQGSGSNGTLNLGGTNLTVNGEFWIGNNTGATGTLNYTTGNLTTTSWVTIGRKDDANAGVGATGTVTMSGGTWTKSGESNFVVGDTGNGTMTMTGGLVEVLPHLTADRGITWIANRNNCTGSLDISGTAEFRSPRIVVGVEGGTTGALGLNGGTVRTSSISGGGGDGTVMFNGTSIIATGSSEFFIDNLFVADIAAGGLIVDSAGFNLNAYQSIGGTGDVTKSGAGTLRLAGSNSYSGDHHVNGGKLLVSVASSTTGDTTVADGAGFGVIQDFGSGTLFQNNLTCGSSGATTLDIDLGDNPGNPFSAPLNVTGTLTLNGPVTINVQDLEPEIGSIPLLTYTAPKSGTGSFVEGTLPLGVSGSIVDDGNGLVSLVVDAVAFPVWTGAVNNTWDTTTANWQDDITFNAITYADGLPVVFDDLAPLTAANITLNSTVAPGSIRFESFGNPYVIAGTGKITGATGLLQAGATDLTINTANDFTGPVEIQGGTTFINSPASLGAGTSPVVLNGGSLNYTGPDATMNRGLTVSVPGTFITTTNSLNVSGPVTATGGSLVKEGPGNLTLSHPGQNIIGSVANGLLIHNGTVTLDGSGTQTNSVTGELWLADQPDVSANLVLNNTSLTTTNWIAIGRGNGDTGVTHLTATNSTINSVNYSAGFNNGLANNASEQFVTLNNTTWTNNGVTYLAESADSTTTMTLNGTSQFNVSNNFRIAMSGTSNATFNLNDSSSVTKTGGYFSVGDNGTGVMNITDTASFTATNGDFNVGDVGTSTGTLNLSGSGLVNITQAYIGKNGGTTGFLNQTGGTFQSASFITIGSGAGGIGTVNLSAGSLTAATVVNVGAAGTGTLNVSGTASVTANGDGVFVGSAAGGTGTLNLNGGTVTTKRLAENTGGVSTVNFNGGLLKAAAGANPTFVGPIDNATIQVGGAFIDTSGQTLSFTANLGGTGALAKSGAGTLTLSGAYSYTGNTTVSAGTLSLAAATLADASTVTIASGAVLNLPHGAVDQVNSLILGGVSQPAGTYTSATPGGYITGTGSLQVSGAVSPYDTWMAGFPSIPLADRDPGDDPDGDGATNAVEFALGSTPDSGSSRPKIYPLVADSDADGDTTKEMLVTIAVLTGTPAFSGSPSPAATMSGYTYTVEGSTTLGAFTTAAVPVGAVTAGLPAAPAGYEYRTFSLSGSNGTPGKGFLRVNVTP